MLLEGSNWEKNLVQFDLAASRPGFSLSLLFRETTSGNLNFKSDICCTVNVAMLISKFFLSLFFFFLI